MEPMAGLVLCGGGSERMGRDKALVLWDGVPLWRHVADGLATIADPVMLAPGTPGRLGDTGLPELADERPVAGPLAGVMAGLRAAPHDAVAVVAVDMPFASAPVFRLLRRLRGPAHVAVPVTARGSQPLHAVWGRTALPLLQRAATDEAWSLRAVLERLSVRWVEEPEWRPLDPDGRFDRNLNRPEDLPHLR